MINLSSQSSLASKALNDMTPRMSSARDLDLERSMHAAVAPLRAVEPAAAQSPPPAPANEAKTGREMIVDQMSRAIAMVHDDATTTVQTLEERLSGLKIRIEAGRNAALAKLAEFVAMVDNAKRLAAQIDDVCSTIEDHVDAE